MPNVIGMDPNGRPAKFVTMQPHMRLVATSHNSLYKLYKVRGHQRLRYEVAWPQTISGDYLGPYQLHFGHKDISID